VGLDFESARKKLNELVAWAATHAPEVSRNEVTTRLHLIDRLLFECLVLGP